MFEKEAAARNAAAAASGQVRLNCKDNTSNLGAPLLAGATDGQSETCCMVVALSLGKPELCCTYLHFLIGTEQHVEGGSRHQKP